MVNVTIESKRLALQLKNDEDLYIRGELDLKGSLERTDQLFQQVLAQSDEEPTTANNILHDSHLMKIQTRLARQCAKYYKPDSLVFNPSEFSIKLAQYYNQLSTNQRGTSTSQKMDELLWMKMGDFAKKLLYTVPSFNFIHGTFDPDPVQVVKKKRKIREKDKIGDVTKPHSMSLEESDTKDPTIQEAERVLTVFNKLCKKTDEKLVCYFEFVTDPTSFSVTVENIFIVSLLAKEGCIKIIKDKNGSPYLAKVEEKERKERNPAIVKQCIVSISKDEWQDIVRTFKFKKPLIPPRKPVTQRGANS